MNRGFYFKVVVPANHWGSSSPPSVHLLPKQTVAPESLGVDNTHCLTLPLVTETWMSPLLDRGVLMSLF